MLNEHFKVCVIGGGLAGLSIAKYLLDLGLKNVIVLEASERVGGLLKSEGMNGYVFDVGGSHIIFSRSPEVMTEMTKLLDGDVIHHRRNTKIHYKGRFIKYPFENGLKDLPPEERYECLKGVLEAYIARLTGRAKEPRNFLEWIKYVFGEAIASKYLIPYNRKIWKTNLSKISLDWVGGRVPNPPLDDIIRAAVGLDVEGYKHQLNFCYPREGGIETLAKSLARLLNMGGAAVKVNAPVTSVEYLPRSGIVEVSAEGFTIKCECVVYTAPLNRSQKILKPVLREKATLLNELKTVSLAVVGVGIRGPTLPYHWIYFPETSVSFHRVGILSNYSPANAPPGNTALIAEVSFKEGSIPPKTRIEREVLEGLEDVGLLKTGEVEVTETWIWRDAYVLYDDKRRKILAETLTPLKEVGIFPHGRFGSWEYLNMDAVLLKSRELAANVVSYLKHPTRYNY